IRVQPGRERQFVHDSFLGEEIRRIEWRPESSNSQVALRAEPMIDNSSVRNVIHVVLRQPDLVEANTSCGVHYRRLGAKGKMLHRCDSRTGMTPLLVLECDDLPGRVYCRFYIRQMCRAVVVVAEFLLTAHLETDWFAELLRHNRRGRC